MVGQAEAATAALHDAAKEFDRSTDVFTIELLDMKQHHRVLYGEDVLSGLRIAIDLHRVQVEYELREKLILLRQHILIADGNDAKLWDLMLRSAPSFSYAVSPCFDRFGDSSQSSPARGREGTSTTFGI